MSKLSDKIRKATRLQSLALGFGSARNEVDPTMVLAALARDPQAAEDLARRGADVVIVEAAGTATPSGMSKDGAVIGARIPGRADNEAKSYKDAGYDFVLFNPDEAAATALLEENIGYVMAAPDDLTDTQWRTLEGFQLDAIDIGALDGAMTVRRQIDLRRIFSMTRKPLMATSAPTSPSPRCRPCATPTSSSWSHRMPPPSRSCAKPSTPCRSAAAARTWTTARSRSCPSPPPSATATNRTTSTTSRRRPR